MPWVRLDDQFYDHAKFIKAGPLGIALWVTGLAWSNRNLTDGFVPAAQVSRLCNFDGLAHVWHGEIMGGGEDVTPMAVALQLVDCEPWEEVEGGYHIHDFLKYQPSRRQVETDRKKVSGVRKQAGSKGGSKAASKRAAKRLADEQQPGEQSAKQTGSPKPKPLVNKSSSGEPLGADPSDDDDRLRKLAAADLTLREAEKGPVADPAAWIAAAVRRRRVAGDFEPRQPRPASHVEVPAAVQPPDFETDDTAADWDSGRAALAGIRDQSNGGR